MITVPEEIIQDVRAINRIPAITNILEVVSRTTGMGFAAVARVTKRSLGGAINNKIDFGLKEGDELQIQTTICNEICQSRQAVIIT